VAEDLKELTKIKVHPGGARAIVKEKEKPEAEISKHTAAQDLESFTAKQANFVKMNKALINADEGGSDDEDDDPSKQYIYMELESTQGMLADVDIDAMFNSTSVEEFMKQIARKGSFSGDQNVPRQRQTQDAMEMISDMVSGADASKRSEDKAQAPKLDFSKEANDEIQFEDSDTLRLRAM